MANVGTSRDGTTGRNVNASIDIKRLVSSMEEKLNYLSRLSSKYCIYKVPKKFRKINEDAYNPVRVSIGPLHHGKRNLKDMEELKWRHLQNFLQRTRKSLEELVEFMKEKEERIRECYAEPINFKSHKFVQIILVDAAFIFEVLLKIWFPVLQTPNDRIFGNPWLIYDITNDFLLLENQLPFFVLQDLFEMANIEEGLNDRSVNLPRNFIQLTFVWFRVSGKILEHQVPKENDLSGIKHFTDFLRICLGPKEISPRIKWKFKFIPSATQLYEAGVRFQVGSNKSLFDIKFEGSVLKIPYIKITDSTERLLRNLIAFEQCHCGIRFVTDYAFLMDCLVNTSKDVELLVKYGVIENWLGDNDSVSNLFNKLCREVILGRSFYFSELYKKLNGYRKNPRHEWEASLRHNYCNTPWRILSIVVALILLVLTFIQAICSLISI